MLPGFILRWNLEGQVRYRENKEGRRTGSFWGEALGTQARIYRILYVLGLQTWLGKGAGWGLVGGRATQIVCSQMVAKIEARGTDWLRLFAVL